MSSQLDLHEYRQRAEDFLSDLDREYYLHFSGQQEEFGIAAIYDRFSDLFERSVVDQLRTLATDAQDDERRRLRSLLQFCVEGLLGQATKEEEAALAGKEASLEIEVGGATIPYRQSTIAQANERDADRRQQIEQARLAVIEDELNPLHERVLESAHRLARDLGWADYRTMHEELKGIDFAALEEQTQAFFDASEARFEPIVEPELERQLGYGFDRLRRADLAYFMRGASMDEYFPADRLLPSFIETMTGLGINVEAQKNVILDLQDRPKKTPRAFCAPVRIPDEIYLVVPRIGGRDDYFALFHEGGHSEHYAHMEHGLPFEFRYLGDNSITEGFAFLFHHLVEDPSWLANHLGIKDSSDLDGYGRAGKLIYLRRYAAKLRYELDLHSADGELRKMRSLYADLLSAAVHTEWPGTTYLSDVDAGYYATSYLRAWAFESQLRQLLRERFGDHWFDRKEAGGFLKSIWSHGQRLSADELLNDISGRKLDFTVMLDELGG